MFSPRNKKIKQSFFTLIEGIDINLFILFIVIIFQNQSWPVCIYENDRLVTNLLFAEMFVNSLYVHVYKCLPCFHDNCVAQYFEN